MMNKIPFNIMPAEFLIDNLESIYKKNIKPLLDEMLKPDYTSCTYKLSEKQRKIISKLNNTILNVINISGSKLTKLEIEENKMEFNRENILEMFEKINNEYCEYLDIEKWSKLNDEINNIYEKNENEYDYEEEDDEYYEL